jgi:Na+/melibiose symporter-like transporter
MNAAEENVVMSWKTALRSILLPQLSVERLFYRLPFYLNMVCLGVIYTWYYRYDFFTYGANDASALMSIMFLLGFLSWCGSVIMVSDSFHRKKKPDYFGLGYLLFSLIAALLLFLSDLQFMHIGPSS